MWRWRPKTLLWQLGLALMVLQVAMAAFFGLRASSEVRSFHERQTSDELARLATLVSGMVVEPIQQGTTSLQVVAREVGEATGARVTIIAPDGTVLADSERDPTQMDDHRFRPEIDSALDQGAGRAMRFSVTMDATLMYAARSIEVDGRVLGVARVALPQTTVDQSINRLLAGLAVLGAVLLALTVTVIYLLSRTLSRTVMRLARGATQFAAGDLSHRIHRPPNSELGVVADAFNRMAGQIQSQLEQVRSQQAEQQAILRSMRNGVLALDAEQRVLSVNRAAARMLGINERSERGRLLQEVVREPALHRFVSETITGARRVHEELTIDRAKRRIIEVLAEPLEDDRGAIVGLLIVLNDVTQLRRLEAMRTDFAANVSHELQTPITAIKGYAETLLEARPKPSGEARRFLEIIRRNADRLAAIIDDLLDLARLEQPEAARDLEREEVPVAPMFQSILGQFEHAASENGITFSMTVEPELHVRVNPRLVEQAVANLVSNAVKFSEPHTSVTLRGASANGHVEISVTDEGPGIAEEHLPRLFERFYRVDRARSREKGGTGLGLALVKHIAMVHGGRAEVESTPGKGSTFRIVLPDARDEAAGEPGHQSEA